MNELEEIMNGKHEIKHLKINNDTLTFNTELNNYDWNLTPRDIEMIIYTLQEDKNNLQSKIDKAIELLEDFKSNSKDVENEWAVEICEMSIRKLKENKYGKIK